MFMVNYSLRNALVIGNKYNFKFCEKSIALVILVFVVHNV